jgi:hypothetical protein
MTTTTVLSFTSKRPARSDADREVPSHEVVWPVRDLPDEAECGQWLNDVIAGTPYEGTALSLWTHHQNLRESAEKLACFITPKWPSSQGGSLLQQAVHAAVTGAQEAIDQGQAFEGRLVGVYIFGLISVVQDIASLVVRGRNKAGQSIRWEYFSQPLLEWAREHGIEEVVVTKSASRPSAAMLEGLRTHLLARIADPIDAGYLAKHAPHG